VNGRGWAYAGAVLGGAVSVAANVAHSYVPPAAGWPVDTTGPELGAVAAAVFWPVALLVAVEILARIAWPEGWRWTAVRFGGLLPVALVAAFVSYQHLSGLLAHYREDAVTAHVGPLAVDGLMVLATAALLATSTGQVRRGLAHLPAQPVVRAEPVTEPVTEPVEQPPAIAAAGVTHPARQVVHAAAPPAPGGPTRAALRALLDAEPDLSRRAAAARLGISPTTVTRALRHPDLIPAPDGAPVTHPQEH
jgi:hypothetical protein